MVDEHEEKLVEVSCGNCNSFYTAREGSWADKNELCPRCVREGKIRA